MSSYSTGYLKAQILDSNTHRSKFRTEFKLDDDVIYMSDFKLLNVGVTSTGANYTYNRLVGTYGTIERITLYDGRTKLDEIRHFDTWAGWKNLKHTNQNNADIQGELSCANVGMAWHTRFDVDVQYADKATTQVTTTTGRGYLDLRQFLPLLNALSILPHRVFPNLRLEIEYQTDGRKFSSVDNIDFANLDPLLKINKVEDESAMRKLEKTFQSVTFNAIEHDEYVINGISRAGNAVAGGTAVFNSQKLNGFNGKNIVRMLIVNQHAFAYPVDTFTGNAVQGYGNAGSICNSNTSIQIKLNGANILPRSKQGANALMALTTDAWNQYQMYPAGNMVNMGAVDTLVQGGAELKGQTAYVGLYVGSEEPVQDLQIEYSRNSLNHTTDALRSNSQQRVLVFCEVPKSLVWKNGEYNLVYN